MLDKSGNVVKGVYCIGDANGKLMLAHAASAQGIAAVETMLVRASCDLLHLVSTRALRSTLIKCHAASQAAGLVSAG